MTNIGNVWRWKDVNTSKVMFLVFLTIVSLCVVNTQPVKSQNLGIISILSDGSIFTSTNATVPIQRVGNVYTLTDNINEYYIVIQRDNIVVDGAGYTLSGQGEIGIDLSYRKNVTIKNVQIGYAYYGIYLLNGSGNTISENILRYNGAGMFIAGSSQNTITGNSMTNNEMGIDLRSSSNNIFRNNDMNNSHNLAVYGTQASHFDNDIDVSNIVNGKKLYYLISETNLVINPTTFPDLGFLALVNCKNITIHDMEFTSNGQGLILAYTTDSTITQNDITSNYNGIALFSSSSNVIIGNNITNNYRGIQLSISSTTNSISTNNIAYNREGIFFFDSPQNSFTGNNITNNEQLGIGFRSSSYNVIRGNYFVNNTRQVYDANFDDTTITASTNIWDVGYPVGGNYWSDYTGVDVKSGSGQNQTGSDQLGDTPYVIYGSNQDNFPLMPYGSPPAISIGSPENKTYTVNSVSLTVTVSETTSWIKYSLDGQANVTYTEGKTLSDLSDGVHSVTVYAQDTDGLTGTSETIYFTITEGAEPPQSEDFSIILIAAIIVVVVVGVALIYFLKIKKK